MRTKGSQKWLPISQLPDHDEQWCVFAHFIMGMQSKPLIIQNWVSPIMDAKIWREWDLANQYTHFLLIRPPKL